MKLRLFLLTINRLSVASSARQQNRTVLPLLCSNQCRTYSVHQEPISLTTEAEILHFLCGLQKSERDRLAKVLQEVVQKSNAEESSRSNGDAATVSSEETRSLFVINTLPFIGFGILDNLLMILAGEYIDATMGVMLGISTMAAAGLGNIISDLAGVGSAHYVEYLVAKIGVKMPLLSREQWDSSKVRWTCNAGRALGLMVGCLIGMFPLLFFDETSTQERKLQAKQTETQAATAVGGQT